MSWPLWIVAALITTASVGLLLHPLLRSGGRGKGTATAAHRDDYDISIYRDQLEEIEKDQARGVLTATEADAARLEIQRRLLAAGRRKQTADEGRSGARKTASSKLVALFVLLLVPFGALSLYLWLGQPDVPSLPMAERTAEFQQHTEMRQLTMRLRQRLEQNPEDPRGWELLGRAESELGEWNRAAEAYRQAAARLEQVDPSLQSALGEAITAAGGGTVTPEAKAAFDRALAVDPEDPRARYYSGLWLQQAGRPREALDVWLELAESTSRDAPWRPLLRQRIVSVAEELQLPVAELKIPEGREPQASAPAGAEAEIEAMSPEERQAFVRSMVDGLAARLAEEPEDLDGWLRLVQARLVLGEPEEALAALRQAAKLVKDLPEQDQRRQAVEEGLRLLEPRDAGG